MANLTDTALDFTMQFDCATKTCFWTDNLDYADFNVPAATIRGLGQAWNPLTGVLFVDKLSPASALITNLNTTTKESADYDLPLDSSGEIVNGAYSFNYSVYVPYTAVNQAVTSFSSVGNVIQVNGVDWSWMEAGDPFTVSGNVSNNGVKTVVSVSVVGGNSLITVAETLVSSMAGGEINFTINKTYSKTITQTFNGCDEVTPELTMVSDCLNGQFGSMTVSDTTTYGTQTVSNRVIQVYAPNGLTPAPAENPWETASSSEAAITISTLATGLWTAILEGTVSYTGTDGLVVTYEFEAPTNVFTSTVVCSTQLCDLQPCINNLNNQIQGCSNPTQDQLILSVRVNSAQNLFRTAQECGDTATMAAQIAILQELLGDNGCGCGSTSTDGPEWVNNNAASGQTTINELIAEIATLTTIVNNYEQGSELLFKSTWVQSGDGSSGQIVPFTIPKEYYEVGTVAPYYESPAFAKMVIEFKVAQPTAQIVLYNQTDGAAWATLNVGALGVTGGRITMYWSSWNQLPACTLITEYENSTNEYTHDEGNLTGVAADWDLTQDLLVNIQPNDFADINYAFVEVIGHRLPTATS